VAAKDFAGSISGAAAGTYETDGKTKAACQRIMAAYAKSKPTLDDPSVKDWVLQVLGYFRNSWSLDGVRRNVNDKDNIVFTKSQQGSDSWKSVPPKGLNISHHLGVMYVRSHYPQYMPKDSDFKDAYWGKKPTE
jgi:hypothetical protein